MRHEPCRFLTCPAFAFACKIKLTEVSHGKGSKYKAPQFQESGRLRAAGGSITTMIDSTNAHASFVADLPGTYKVRLVVNNGFVTSEPVYAAIIVVP